MWYYRIFSHWWKHFYQPSFLCNYCMKKLGWKFFNFFLFPQRREFVFIRNNAVSFKKKNSNVFLSSAYCYCYCSQHPVKRTHTKALPLSLPGYNLSKVCFLTIGLNYYCVSKCVLLWMHTTSCTAQSFIILLTINMILFLLRLCRHFRYSLETLATFWIKIKNCPPKEFVCLI